MLDPSINFVRLIAFFAFISKYFAITSSTFLVISSGGTKTRAICETITLATCYFTAVNLLAAFSTNFLPPSIATVLPTSTAFIPISFAAVFPA